VAHQAGAYLSFCSDRAEKRLRMCEISWLTLVPTAWAPYQTSKHGGVFKTFGMATGSW